MAVNMLLGDEQGAKISGLGWDVEQHPGLALAHTGEGPSAYASLPRDEPQLVVAVGLGLLEVVELEFHLLVARWLRTKLGHAPVAVEHRSLLGGWDQLDGGHRCLFSQEAKDYPCSHYGNRSGGCHAGDNDAKVLEAVEA